MYRPENAVTGSVRIPRRRRQMGLASFPLSVKIRVTTTKGTCTDSLWSLPILPSTPLILSYKMRNPSCQVPMGWRVANGSLYVQSLVLLWREAELWRFSFMPVFEARLLAMVFAHYYHWCFLGRLFPEEKELYQRSIGTGRVYFSAFVIWSPGLMAWEHHALI